MSNKTYQEYLDAACTSLDEILPQELYLQQRAAKWKKIKNPREALTTVYRMYATFIKIVDNLEHCYDQMLQPQKRVVIRVLLDASLGRMLELKDELVKLEMSDFTYNDDALAQMRLTPCDLELRTPRYIAREREAERLERNKIMEAIYIKLHPPEAATEEAKDDDEEEEGEEDDELAMLEEKPQEQQVRTSVRVSQIPRKSRGSRATRASQLEPGEERPSQEPPPEEAPPEEPEPEELKGPKIRETPQHRREMFAAKAAERQKVRDQLKKEAEEKRMEEIRDAIRTIQIHERARQARYEFQVAHNIASMRAEEGQKRVTEEEKQRREAAAFKIQHAWKQFKERRQRRHRAAQESQLLYMARKSGPLDKTQRERAKEVCRLRYGPQEDFREEFEYAEIRELEEYMDRHAPWLLEDYTDEIRDWFRYWYAKIKNFPPEYPTEEEGGSLKILAGEMISPMEWQRKQEEEEAAKKKKGKEKKPPKKTKEQLREEKKKEQELEAKRKRDEEKRKKQDEIENPGFMMNPSNYLGTLFTETESFNETWRSRGLSGNPEQRHYQDLIEQDKHLQVQLEVRRIVDELMRLELERLKEAVAKDVAKAKGKKYKKKRKKKKKEKPPKPPRPPRDMTGDRTLESLMEELMEAGILVYPIPEIHIEQMEGDYNYTAYEKRLLMQDPLPAVGDARNLLHQYCILPFGSPVIRQSSPLVRAVCIVGPKDSGKHMMVNAICTETGAYMFDLSPEVIAGKYKGGAGTKMFDHLMFKMTRLLQPAIIFIDGAEKPFYKRVPKPERKFEPKRLAKWLPKFAKQIKPEDQVMIIGTTNQPWAGSPKKLTKLYEKFIFIPRTDYGTSAAVWREQLMRNHLVSRDMDISAIARCTAGIPVGVIKYIVKKVLNRKRILELPFKPLTPAEVFETAVKYELVSDDDFKKFTDFFSKKTKIGKMRAKMLREWAEEQEKLNKMQKK